MERFRLSRRDFLKIGGGAAIGYILGRYMPNTSSVGEQTSTQPKAPEIFPFVESGFEENALQNLYSRIMDLDQKVRDADPQKLPSWANQETGEYVTNSPNWSDALFVGALGIYSNENSDFFNPLVKFYTDSIIEDGGAYQKLLNEKSPDVAWTSFLSLVPTYEITGDEKYKNLALDAADFLVDSLYDEKMKLFPTAINSDQYIVNSTLTVTPLLFWAEKNEEDKTKAKKYGDIGRKYIESAIKHFARPDGSVFHAVEKSNKGGLIKGETRNPTGYPSDGSSPTRVLGAFIFALATAYRENPQRKDFLGQAIKSLNFAIKNTPAEIIMPFDIGPIPKSLEKYKDTSGQSAIACSALELASLVEDSLTKKNLTNYGRGLLKDIAENHMTKYGGVANALQGYWAIRDFENGKTDIPVQIETINGDYWFALALIKSKDLG